MAVASSNFEPLQQLRPFDAHVENVSLYTRSLRRPWRLFAPRPMASGHAFPALHPCAGPPGPPYLVFFSLEDRL